jgi:paired amphipathic helix protein Sin3a
VKYHTFILYDHFLNNYHLRRNLPMKPTEPLPPLPPLIARGGLEIKICVRTYRPFFVTHTEDILFRKPLKTLTVEAIEQLKEQKRKKIAQIGA